jgi:TatA/E family protein of Tat protein translocase
MGTVGVQEMVVIFVLALVLFGPKKLPELGRTIGKAITEFRRASNDLKATFEREMQTLERENQSISQVANVTAGDIFNRAINYDPDHETRSLPPAETAWNPLEPQKVDAESQESNATPDSSASAEHQTSASLSTATDPSTVGASAISGAESNGTIAETVPSPEPVPAIEGTVPRSEQSSAQPQHS